MTVKILKTCNCCLPRNKKVRLMGARAKIGYCRSCHMRTVWEAATDEMVAEYHDRNAKKAAFLDELLQE